MNLKRKVILYLIRHGATAANERRPYVLQGSNVDNPLSEEGRRQASAVAKFFASIPLSAVYCSHMTRAVETANMIAESCGLTASSLDSIHEVNVGQWEGLSWNEIEERHREAYEAFIASPGTTAYLGGESYANVLTRSEPIFTALFSKHLGERIAVVAHNVVNRAYLSHLLGLDINFAKSIEQTNTGVNVIEYDADKNRAAVITLNCDFHVPGKHR